MPGIRAHDTITWIGGVLLAPLSLAVPSPNHWLSALTLSGSFLLSGLLFSCDLDVPAGEYRRWGPLRRLWWPYERLLPHRSWLSHGLVIGPLLRLAYFGLVVDLLVSLLALVASALGLDGRAWLQDWHRFWADLVRYDPRPVAEVLSGFVLGGAAHSLPDWWLTGMRRLF